MIEERHRVEPSAMRQAIARLMTESKQRTPHFYLSTVVEMDALLTTADQANSLRPGEARATVTAYLVRAVALTLLEHPAFNASGTAGLWSASLQSTSASRLRSKMGLSRRHS